MLFKFGAPQAALQFVAFLFDNTDRLGDRKLPRDVAGFESGLQRLDFRFFRRGGFLQRVHQPGLGQPGCGLLAVPGLFEFVGKHVTLFFHRAQGLGHGEFARNISGIEPGLQFLDLGVPDGSGLLQFAGGLGLGEFDRVAFILFSQRKPLVQLLFEIAVANLLQNVRVPGLINLECLPAVRADDFMHDYLPPGSAKICKSISGATPPALRAFCKTPRNQALLRSDRQKKKEETGGHFRHE
ncbi:MAG: hypothetical protein LBE06_06250 [Azoarcus sp.]|nr:hypothetical protein [Azoarcus sp.]